MFSPSTSTLEISNAGVLKILHRPTILQANIQNPMRPSTSSFRVETCTTWPHPLYTHTATLALTCSTILLCATLPYPELGQAGLTPWGRPCHDLMLQKEWRDRRDEFKKKFLQNGNVKNWNYNYNFKMAMNTTCLTMWSHSLPQPPPSDIVVSTSKAATHYQSSKLILGEVM
ncbi:hypothetical protein CR513_35572, partial [Mucuna pruriens]